MTGFEAQDLAQNRGLFHQKYVLKQYVRCLLSFQFPDKPLDFSNVSAEAALLVAGRHLKRLPAIEWRSLRNASGGNLKHQQKAFVVETKRRRGRSTSAKSHPIEDAFSAAVRAYSLEADAIDRLSVAADPPMEGSAAKPPGRILPSLIEDQTPYSTQKLPGARPIVVKPPRHAKAEKAQPVSTGMPLQSRNARGAESSLTLDKTKEAGITALTLRQSSKPSHQGAQVAVVDLSSNATSGDATSDGQAPTPRLRRGLILDRYVRGAALKFGERWKLRLRRGPR